MLKILLALLLFAPIARAQEINLTSIPSDYAFSSISPEATVTVRLIERQGTRYLFEEAATYADGTQDAILVWVNQQSQTISWGAGGTTTRYAPHDCAPSNGLCLYTWTDEDGVYQMKSTTTLFGDVWVSDTFFKDGDTWTFWERNCTTYDEFGFWIDFVRIYNDDETDSGARLRPAPDRLDELWRLCKPPLLTS